MKRIKRNLFFVGLALTGISIVMKAPEDTRKYRGSTSTFPQTCQKMKVVDDVLEADCVSRDGDLVYTNILLRGIENIDGDLVATNLDRESDFSETCDNLSVKGNVLQATCRTKNGGSKNTSIVLNGIDNVDGTLRYTSDIVFSYVPQIF